MEGENEGECEGHDDGDDERALEGGSLGDVHTRPFILPTIWTINDFNMMMAPTIFKTLRDRYQNPDDISLCLLGKFEKCYSRRTTDVGMYNSMFMVGLRLPLMELHHQLAIFLGLSVSKIAPNA